MTFSEIHSYENLSKFVVELQYFVAMWVIRKPIKYSAFQKELAIEIRLEKLLTILF